MNRPYSFRVNGLGADLFTDEKYHLANHRGCQVKGLRTGRCAANAPAMSKGARAASSSHFLTSAPRLDILTDVAPDRSIRALGFGETHSAVPYPLLFGDVLEPRS